MICIYFTYCMYHTSVSSLLRVIHVDRDAIFVLAILSTTLRSVDCFSGKSRCKVKWDDAGHLLLAQPHPSSHTQWMPCTGCTKKSCQSAASFEAISMVSLVISALLKSMRFTMFQVSVGFRIHCPLGGFNEVALGP